MGSMRKKLRSLGEGFTLIEAVTVLLLVGILSAFAIARMTTVGDTDLASQIDVIKNHLRYAQSKAMSTGSPWGVKFDTSKTYFLFDDAARSTQVLFPGEENTTVNLNTKKSDLTITSATPLAPQTITFDAYGSPGETTITVSTNGGDIVVTKNTGYIP